MENKNSEISPGGSLVKIEMLWNAYINTTHEELEHIQMPGSGCQIQRRVDTEGFGIFVLNMSDQEVHHVPYFNISLISKNYNHNFIDRYKNCL